MKHGRLHRRELLLRGGGCVGMALAGRNAIAAEAPASASVPMPSKPPASFRYCLNTSTIRGQKLSLPEEVEIAAAAGYQAIEPWLSEIQDFVRQGGRLADLRKRIADLGLTVESAISFEQWTPEAWERLPEGLESWKRSLDLLAQLGGRRICAPPCGKLTPADCDLQGIAARYRRILTLGRSFGVVPEVELWGFAPVLRRLGEIAYVLVESGDPDACAVLDVIHIHTGGSPLAGLRAFNGRSLRVFHMNDYPPEVARDRKLLGPRVYPGDGVAPLDEILRSLQAIGFAGFLSLELFNETYWQQPARTVAKVGLEKMRAAVARAIGQ